MATGELPFRGATPFELSVEIMVGTPPKLAQLPEPLQSTLRRCLEKDPMARFPQVSELASALEGNAAEAEPASARARSRRPHRGRRATGGAPRFTPPAQVVGGRRGNGALRVAAGGHLRPARLGLAARRSADFRIPGP